MPLNAEKLEVLKYEGNTLVIANPGTGKTLLLAHKYVNLLKKGIKPEEILCLTFTKKAKKEMEERIIKILNDEKIKVDYANLNIYTFHAYALDEIGKEETIPTNFLRYSIYKYFKENETLNYSDEYLLETIVPKMENLLRYLKSFGIMPDSIDIEKVKAELDDYKKLSKEEMDKFAESFVDVYRCYENVKKDMGIDYADMLLEFTNLKHKKQFKHVLVDEMQDVNTTEADIALDSGETFFAVGDKKQAIFGFQGGSVMNFRKFQKAKTFVLSENFRSTNAILDYAKECLLSKTKDKNHEKELKELKNNEKPKGEKPVVYDIPSEDAIPAACEIVKKLAKEHEKVAIIARTNLQIMRISKELHARGIEHSSSYFAASNDARIYIINFLKGILSSRINDIRNSMFTPFFPITLQDAFELTEIEEKELTIEQIFKKSPEFRKMRESITTIEKVNDLFRTRIMPVSIAYGHEYTLAAMAVHKSFNEAIRVLDKISFREVINYLKASDPLTDEPEAEKSIVLTTVHKSKGRQFPAVVYVPNKQRDRDNFQDEVVKAILRTKGIDAEEELSEEHLRVNFVALTRAEENLHVIPDKLEEYLNDKCEKKTIAAESIQSFESTERMKQAYNLFLSGNIEKSQKLLKEDSKWLVEYIRKSFEALDHVSFSSLTTDPLEYLNYKILSIKDYSPQLIRGTQVHSIAQAILKGENYEITEKTKPYEENIRRILSQIQAQYPEILPPEKKIDIRLDELADVSEALRFEGYIDAVFKNSDNYIIVDWKTDKDESNGSKHRQQLEAYRRAYSITNNIPLENIKIAIAYIGLKTTVNLGQTDCKLDMLQPSKSSIETFSKKAQTIDNWKKNPETFLKDLAEDLAEKNYDDLMCRAIVEEYKRE